jgi:hypothetical protein
LSIKKTSRESLCSNRTFASYELFGKKKRIGATILSPLATASNHLVPKLGNVNNKKGKVEHEAVSGPSNAMFHIT